MTWVRNGDEVTVRYYLDARLVYSENAAYRQSKDDAATRVGRWAAANGSALYVFKGLLDEVIVYQRTLSDADVAALYHRPLKAAPSIGSVFSAGGGILGPAQPTLPDEPLSVPTDSPLQTPTQLPEDLPRAPVPTAQSVQKTDWEIVSVQDLGGNSNGLLDERENLRLNVRIRKTGADKPFPIRIKAKQVQADANWQGSDPGIKYDVDAPVGEIKTIVVPVNYTTRFEAGVESYVFNLELTQPDGSKLKDANADNNVKRMNYGLKEKRQAIANIGYKRQLRRSGVAGAKGNRVWRQVAPKGAILRHLSITDVGGLGGYYHAVTSLDQTQLPTLNEISVVRREAKVADRAEGRVSSKSMVSTTPAAMGVFGIRANTATPRGLLCYACIGYPEHLPPFELWMRDRIGGSLGQNLTREKQWNGTVYDDSEWRPWQYCPKDGTGQRMVAVGFEAHLEEGKTNTYLEGIRLICEPLAQALDPREGPVQYYNSKTGKWEDG